MARARGRARDSQRPGHVCGVGRNLVSGDEVGRRLETLVGERDRVAQPVARAGRPIGMRQVRDGLGRAYHGGVQIGGERDHVRQVLIAAGLQPDRRAGGAVGEEPVDPDQLGVEPELVDVVGRLVGEVLAVDRDRAVEEVVGRVRLVAEHLAVEGRAVARQAAVTLVGDEAELGADPSAQGRLKSADRDRDGRLVLRDRLQPVEHGQVSGRFAGGLVGDHQCPAGVPVLTGRRLHVRDRVHPGSGTLHPSRDVDERGVGARDIGALVDRGRQVVEAGCIRRLEVDLAQARQRRVRCGLPARSCGRARPVVQAREQHSRTGGQAQASGRGIESRGVGVHAHHREVVVVQHGAQPGARVCAVGHRRLTGLERVPDDRDVAVRVRAEPRREGPGGQRGRREADREHRRQHDRTSDSQKSSLHGPPPLDNP